MPDPVITPAPQNVPVDVTTAVRPEVVVAPPAPDPVQPVDTSAIAAEESAAQTVATELATGKPFSPSQLEGVLTNLMPAVQETKAGYKTTEFWLSLIGIAATQLQLVHLPGKYGDTFATIGIAVSYVVSRGLAKSGSPYTPSK